MWKARLMEVSVEQTPAALAHKYDFHTLSSGRGGNYPTAAYNPVLWRVISLSSGVFVPLMGSVVTKVGKAREYILYKLAC